MVMHNRIFKKRTQGIGNYTLDEAVDWGVTGPGLRACGLEWDFRKQMPYSGYEQFEFDIPTALHGDCYDRALVRVEEMRQSLRIIQQCVKNMPAGPYKARHPLTTPPLREHTLQDIETLIHHFLSVSWGPVIPAGEASFPIEATKGIKRQIEGIQSSTEDTVADISRIADQPDRTWFAFIEVMLHTL